MSFVDATKMREHALRMAEEETALEETIVQLSNKEHMMKKLIKQDDNSLHKQEHENTALKQSISSKIAEFEALRSSFCGLLLGHRADSGLITTEMENCEGLVEKATDTLRTTELLDNDAVELHQASKTAIREVSESLHGMKVTYAEMMSAIPAKVAAEEQCKHLQQEIDACASNVAATAELITAERKRIAELSSINSSLKLQLSTQEADEAVAAAALVAAEDKLRSSMAHAAENEAQRNEAEKVLTSDTADTKQHCIDLRTELHRLEDLAARAEASANTLNAMYESAQSGLNAHHLLVQQDVNRLASALQLPPAPPEASIQELSDLALMCKNVCAQRKQALSDELNSVAATEQQQQAAFTTVTELLDASTTAAAKDADALMQIQAAFNETLATRNDKLSLLTSCAPPTHFVVPRTLNKGTYTMAELKELVRNTVRETATIISIEEADNDAVTIRFTPASDILPTEAELSGLATRLSTLSSAASALTSHCSTSTTSAALLAAAVERQRMQAEELLSQGLTLQEAIAQTETHKKEVEATVDVQRAEYETKLTEEYVNVSRELQATRSRVSTQIEEAKVRLSNAKDSVGGGKRTPNRFSDTPFADLAPSKSISTGKKAASRVEAPPPPHPAARAKQPIAAAAAVKASKATSMFDLAGFEDDGIIVGKKADTNNRTALGRQGRSKYGRG